MKRRLKHGGDKRTDEGGDPGEGGVSGGPVDRGAIGGGEIAVHSSG